MKTIKILSVVLFITLVCGCSSFKESFNHSRARKKAGITRISQYEKGGTFLWAHYDATKRGSVMYIDDKGNIRILAENPPDAAIQSISEITAKVGEIKGVGNIEAAFKAQKSIAELGKRTAAVNMMRDALYRLNEMYYALKDETAENNKLILEKYNGDKKQTKSLINELNALKTISGDNLSSLFNKVLDNTKLIAIEEARASIEIAKAESNSAIEKAKAQVENSKETQKRIDALLEVYKNVSDSLTKKEKKEYLDKILKLNKDENN